MEINWFTVIAQIINFLILVWLLKRFLYKPVLNAIDEREKKIAAQLSDAEAKKASAQKERDEFEQKNESFDKERASKMNEAQQAANAEKQRLFEEIRSESNVLRLKYEESLEQQQKDITEVVKRKTKNEVIAITGKALSDLADASLEEQIVKVFMKKILALKDEDKSAFQMAFNNNEQKITIKSTSVLTSSSKDELEKVIEKIIGQASNVQYLVDSELISGIEINSESYRLSWNIEAYLDSLKEHLAENEKENATAQPQ
ncbi:MAG: hypothetical protein ABI325_04580 [Ginsengibacter sp.]